MKEEYFTYMYISEGHLKQGWSTCSVLQLLNSGTFVRAIFAEAT